MKSHIVILGTVLALFTGGALTGELGTDAKLNYPYSIAIDGADNIIIADTGNQIIRKLTPAGEIITIAGTLLVNGFSGDGGPATSATLDSPYGVAADLAGNVYIADTYSNRIRKVSTAGIITTIAGNGTAGYTGDGGQAVNATLNGPSGLAIDRNTGDLYIADSYNSVIRHIDGSGRITTFAGNGTFGYSGDNGPATAASLNYPTGVAIGPSGVYIADNSNTVIRHVNGGNITTLAGTGVGDFTGDGGPGSNAQINYAFGVGTDNAGNVYIADTYNQRIRRVDALRNINTICGDGMARFHGDGGGPLLASLSFPNGVAVDSAGAVFIADTVNQRIRRINTSNIIQTIAGGGTGGNGSPTVVTITSPLQWFGEVNEFFYYEISAQGVDPLTFSATGLPDGLFIGGNVISGTPTSAGTFAATITASNNVASDSKTLVITILAEGESVPQVSDVLVFPNPAFTSEEVFLAMLAAGGDDGLLDVIWDFGDGTAGEGVFTFHSYAAPGNYTVTATAIDPAGGLITRSTVVTVTALNPDAPELFDAAASENPSLINGEVTYTAFAFDPKGSALTVQWNFGDGSPVVTGETVKHTFLRDGEFNVTVSAMNAEGLKSRTLQGTQYVFLEAGEDNLLDGGAETENPLNGVGLRVLNSECGVIQLGVEIDAVNREAFDSTTSFGTGRTPSKGTRPSDKFTQAGLYVATTIVTEKNTNVPRGKGRKTIPISRRETDQKRNYTNEPANRKFTKPAIKGAFEATRTTGATSPTAKPKNDKVTVSGEIELPAGLDLNMTQELQLAVGNIIDKMALSKGKAVGSVSQVKLSTKKSKTGLTVAGQVAKFKATFSSPGMIKGGFDTEGVDASSRGKNIKIQCALYLAGVTYALDLPVQVKVSKDETDISIGSVRTSN